MSNSSPRRLALIALSCAAIAALTMAAPASAQFNIGGLIKGVKNAKNLGDSFKKISEPEEI